MASVSVIRHPSAEDTAPLPRKLMAESKGCVGIRNQGQSV
jgi:hypothetical protein